LAVQALIRQLRQFLAGSPRRAGGLVTELLKQAADAVCGAHPEIAGFLADLFPLAQRSGENLGAFLAELSLAAMVDLWDPRADRVSLLTLHASKGLEFPVVFLPGCEDGILPLSWGDGRDTDVAEERRLFFVGLTRARERLILCHAAQRLWRGRMREMTPSPFLAALQEELLERGRRSSRGKAKTSPDRQLQLF
jgi:DNA helicase-2/ATP-dependent DNA helicase PcrA